MGILLIFGLVFFRAQEGISRNLPVKNICLNWGWEDRVSDDVIFIGSSRSFRAIDTFALTEKLAASKSNLQGTDMIFTTTSEIASKLSAFLSMTKNSKVPKVLIIENLFLQKPTKLRGLSKETNLLLKPVDERYLVLENLLYINRKLNRLNSKPFPQTYYSKNLTNAELVAIRLTSTFYDFLSKPSMINLRRSKVCPKIFKKWNSRLSTKNTNFREVYLNNKQHKKYKSRIKNYKPLMPLNKKRKYEVDMMNILIDEAKSRGVEKVYVWLPNDYTLHYSQQEYEELKTVYKSADGVVFKEIVDILSVDDRRALFKNDNHVSLKGRNIISDFWFEFLTNTT
jgi:hypothetical protein